jgi:hypothetical protein
VHDCHKLAADFTISEWISAEALSEDVWLFDCGCGRGFRCDAQRYWVRG